jgi:hypothetical protein
VQFNAKFLFFPLFYIGVLVLLNIVLNGLSEQKILLGPFPFTTCNLEGICSTSIRGIIGSIVLFGGGFLLFLRNMQYTNIISNFLVIVNTIIYTTLTIVGAGILYFIIIIAAGSSR